MAREAAGRGFLGGNRFAELAELKGEVEEVQERPEEKARSGSKRSQVERTGPPLQILKRQTEKKDAKVSTEPLKVYKKFGSLLDSGAAENVIPTKCVPEKYVSRGDQFGKRYISATGNAV